MGSFDGIQALLRNMVGKDTFIVKTRITRPANTTAYTIGDIINNDSATGLIALDFSTLGYTANDIIQITKVLIESNNGAATTQLSPIVKLLNFDLAAGDITGNSVADNAVFNPKATSIMGLTKCKLHFNSVAEAINTSVESVASGYYGFKQTGLDDKIILGADAKLYLALIANNAYTPASGEIIDVKLEGFKLK